MAEWRNLGLDFVTLRVFKAAVEERSLVSAAEREHLAPSAISRRISDFEARLGITLLRRHDRGVEPTAAGQLLMRHVEALFNIVDMTMADLESLSLGQTGSVKILANLSTISGADAESARATGEPASLDRLPSRTIG
jgi:DNA-binding transcriptional LysR family regulator